jgi:hypothetical protein
LARDNRAAESVCLHDRATQQDGIGVRKHSTPGCQSKYSRSCAPSHDYAGGRVGWWLPLRTPKWTHDVHRRFNLSPVLTTWPTVNCKVFQTCQMLHSMKSCTVISDAYVGGSCNLGRETGLVVNNSPIAVLQARPYI